MMGFRRGSAAFFAVAVASSAGCSLISGASDLEVDPRIGFEPVALPDSGRDEASVISRPDGGADGASTDSASDAAVDSAVDGGSRIRTVTFESGTLTGAGGVDSVTGGLGQLSIVSGAQALGSMFSMRADKDCSGRVGFADTSELYATFLVRFENIGLATSAILAIGVAPPLSGLELAVDGDEGIQLFLGNNQIATGGGKLTDNNTYRVGIHIRSGNAGVSLVEVFAGAKGAPFGQPVLSVNNRVIGTPRSAAMGIVRGNSRGVFDDLTLDKASMPAP